MAATSATKSPRRRHTAGIAKRSDVSRIITAIVLQWRPTASLRPELVEWIATLAALAPKSGGVRGA